MVDMIEAVKTAMNNVMDGVYAQDIAYAIGYRMRDYNGDKYHYPKVTIEDIIISVFFYHLVAGDRYVRKWESEDISYWKPYIEVMKEDEAMLTE